MFDVGPIVPAAVVRDCRPDCAGERRGSGGKRNGCHRNLWETLAEEAIQCGSGQR